MVHAHFVFLWGPVFLPVGRSGNEENVGPCWVQIFENIRVVHKIGSKTKMQDVGCDRMVFAINSDICLIHVNSKSNNLSLDQGQKTN